MGAGIAAVTAESELRVRLKDVTAEAVAEGLATVRKSIVERAGKRRLRDIRSSKSPTASKERSTYSGFRSSDLVIEAVFEDVSSSTRHSGDRGRDRRDTILASNTSTIPIATLAESAPSRGELIGLHFFSPVEKMPLGRDHHDRLTGALCRGDLPRLR